MTFSDIQHQVDAFRDEIAAMIADGRGEEAIEAAAARMHLLHHRNLRLELELLAERRRQAGIRSERIDPAQLSMQMEAMPEGTIEDPADLDDTATDDAELTEAIEAAEAALPSAPLRRPRRRPLPDHLPREVIEHTVPEENRACGSCGNTMTVIGSDTSEVLRLIPARFEVEEHRREKLACSRCKDAVVTAPGPAKFIERGRAHPTLLAHVVQSKYQDHLPLARLQHIYGRGGVPLARSTLCDWTARVADELEPLAERIFSLALQTHLVQSDATGLRVLDRDDPNGIRRGTMWCVVGDARYVGFRYAPSGSGTDGPWAFLKDRDGYLRQDHLPLARLQHIYGRGGVPLARSTLCDWTARVADELEPLAERIFSLALQTHLVQSDATGLRVLDRDDPNGIRRGTMWCVVGDARYVGFRYAPSGSGTDGPWAFLKDRDGYLQVDAATVFDRLFDGQIAEATEVGCWAHARRRFEALRDTDSRVAYPLKLIAQLYRVETLADTKRLDPTGRQKLRQERSRKILARLTRWIARTAADEPPESAMHKACAYIVNQHQALLRFLDDGVITLDNNLCELQLRTIAVGRKNYLFAGSDRAAERAAVLYTVIRTAAMAKIDVYAYLVRTLTRIAEGWPAGQLDALLPENHVPDYSDER